MNLIEINRLEDLVWAIEEDGIDLNVEDYIRTHGEPRIDVDGNWWIRDEIDGTETGYIGTLAAAIDRLEAGTYTLLT